MGAVTIMMIPPGKHPKRRSGAAFTGTLALISAAGIAAGISAGGMKSVPASCDIKGNVSFETGERIYHVPGQEYYAATRISRLYGECMFCSEWEVIKAGWRRSKV